MEFDVGTATVKTDARLANQDAFVFHPHMPIYAIADGVTTSHNGMDKDTIALIAATVGVSYSAELAQEEPESWKTRESAKTAMEFALQRVNNVVLRAVPTVAMATRVPEHARSGQTITPELKKAYQKSTTLDLVVLSEQFFTIGHIGDSRVYGLKDGQIIRLTQDQTPEESLWLGEELHRFDDRILQFDHDGLDALILSTDGVTHFLQDDVLKDMYYTYKDESAQSIAQRIIEKAAAVAEDNATVGVIKFMPVRQHKTKETQTLLAKIAELERERETLRTERDGFKSSLDAADIARQEYERRLSAERAAVATGTAAGVAAEIGAYKINIARAEEKTRKAQEAERKALAAQQELRGKVIRLEQQLAEKKSPAIVVQTIREKKEPEQPRWRKVLKAGAFAAALLSAGAIADQVIMQQRYMHVAPTIRQEQPIEKDKALPQSTVTPRHTVQQAPIAQRQIDAQSKTYTRHKATSHVTITPRPAQPQVKSTKLSLDTLLEQGTYVSRKSSVGLKDPGVIAGWSSKNHSWYSVMQQPGHTTNNRWEVPGAYTQKDEKDTILFTLYTNGSKLKDVQTPVAFRLLLPDGTHAYVKPGVTTEMLLGTANKGSIGPIQYELVTQHGEKGQYVPLTVLASGRNLHLNLYNETRMSPQQDGAQQNPVPSAQQEQGKHSVNIEHKNPVVQSMIQTQSSTIPFATTLHGVQTLKERFAYHVKMESPSKVAQERYKQLISCIEQEEKRYVRMRQNHLAFV